MNSLCLFCSYSQGPLLAPYIQFYLANLAGHFSKIIFISSNKSLNDASLNWLQKRNIEILFTENKGWDFGMWYQGLHHANITQFNQIALINDSCVLFKSPAGFFDWLNATDEIDVAGITDSGQYNFHVQSYFMVFNQKAIVPLINYFNTNGICSSREEVIKVYELGLSSHLEKLGLKLMAMHHYSDYIKEGNPSVYAVEKLIRAGIPLIKKKILFRNFSDKEFFDLLKHRFNHHPNHYIKLIYHNNKSVPVFDFNLLRHDGYNTNWWQETAWQLTSYALQVTRFLFGWLWRLIKKNSA